MRAILTNEDGDVQNAVEAKTPVSLKWQIKHELLPAMMPGDKIEWVNDEPRPTKNGDEELHVRDAQV